MTAVLWCLIVVCQAPGSDPLTEVGASSYLATTRGSKWVYQESDKSTFTVVLTAVERTEKRTVVTLELEKPDGKTSPKEKLALSALAIHRIAAVGNPVEPPFCLLMIPHGEVKKWETKLGGEIFQIRGNHSASGPESVRVPAGQFKCIRVESEDVISGGLEDHRNRQTDWFAPGVGVVKSELNGRKTELIKFIPGKE
jgi:hypothetical protein